MYVQTDKILSRPKEVLSEHACVGTSDHTWRHSQGIPCSARKCSCYRNNSQPRSNQHYQERHRLEFASHQHEVQCL